VQSCSRNDRRARTAASYRVSAPTSTTCRTPWNHRPRRCRSVRFLFADRIFAQLEYSPCVTVCGRAEIR
jgi:hypothetical protein